MEDVFEFTDLSERLRGPDAEAAARQALERLRSLRERVGARARDGARPDEYENLGRLSDALACAEAIVISLASARNSSAKDVNV